MPTWRTWHNNAVVPHRLQIFLTTTGRIRSLSEGVLGRIESETCVNRETIARYYPRRHARAANLSTGGEVALEDGEPKAPTRRPA